MATSSDEARSADKAVATTASCKPYRPHPREWRWLPERLLLVKDTAHDLGRAAVHRAVMFSPARAAWMHLRGQTLARTIERAGCLQVHIPRTGGTSLARLLYGRNLPHRTAWQWSLLFGERFETWCRFSVLRDPVERFLSAYRFTLQGGNELILNSRYEMAQLAPMQPFAAFLERMEADPSRVFRVPAFRPQSDFVCDPDGRIMVDRLFAIDRPRLGAPALSRWLGVQALPRLNASRTCDLGIGHHERDRILALYEADARLYRRVVAAGGELVINPAARPDRLLRTAV